MSDKSESSAAGESGSSSRFRHLLPYLAAHKTALTLALMLSVLGAGASLVQPLLVNQVIGRVEAGQALGSLVVILAVLVVLSGVLGGLQTYILQRTGVAVVFAARRGLVRSILNLPIKEFDRRRTGDLVSRVGSDTTLLYGVLTQGLVDAAGGSLVFIGALTAMLIIDPVMLALTLSVVAISVVTVTVLSKRIRRASLEQQRRVGDLGAAVERVLSGIRTVRAANATEREIAKIDRQSRGAFEAGLEVARISAFIVPISGIAMQASFLIVLGVGGYRVASGTISLADLVAFILFLFMMIGPLSSVLGAITSVNQALGAITRIREVTTSPSETDDDVKIDLVSPSSTAAVSFEEVTFSYGDETTDDELSGQSHPSSPVLVGLSFEVQRGSRTAIVGPSGAGKSTVLALLERFYDPSSGVVRLNGTNVRDITRTSLRSQIGYVEQDAPVLAGTIGENLRLVADSATDDECRAVLASVNLDAVLGRSPMGLEASVGEDGVMLSGGERQRLAIARTLLNAPPILLLDESTSSLDSLNEVLLRDAIDAISAQRTLIVIAHRLSTVVDADQIIVLDGGRIVGVGTHSELLFTTPLYQRLAEHQLLA
ncbi:ABC transporter ATP-binding protein [Arthrobacter flavus]|uniref:ABC transporter ATP-binding protein n=1 Tax=Arthrobacter flavus TaxID=95172 RepID=A0ABW4Q3C4_9MICC